MSRHSTKTSASVRCDYCGATFCTYSFAAFVRKQAAQVGWTRRRGKSIADPDDVTCVLALGTVDICPAHGELPKPVKPPKERGNRRAKGKGGNAPVEATAA